MSMAELTTIEPEIDKDSPLPKLSQTRLNAQQSTHTILNRRSQPIGNRFNPNDGECSENEDEMNVSDGGEQLNGGMIHNEDSVVVCIQQKTQEMSEERKISKTSLGSVSPGKHHSHIPVPSRTRGEAGSGKKAATPDKVSPKDCVTRIAKRCTSGQQKKMSATVSDLSGSSSNPKPNAGYLLNARSRSSSNRSIAIGKAKRTENNEQCLYPKISSARKNSTESSLNYTKSYTTITLSSPRVDESDVSPVPDSPAVSSPCSNAKVDDEKDIPSTSISKTSLGCDFDLEQGGNGESSSPAIELLDLRLKDSESELFSTVAGSSMSSTRQTVSTESKTSPKLEILRTPQTTIRTLSGDELVLSSSMEFDEMEVDVLPTENEETISQLLKATEDESFIKAFGGSHVVEDEANEYDSEEGTDVDAPTQNENVVESKTERKDPEKEMMTDVDYRQSVYHPTVLRRQMEEESQVVRRPRSKSIEDNCSFKLGDTEREKGQMSKKSSFKKNLSQTFVSDRDVNITPLRSWSEKTPQDEERQIIYSNLHLLQNSDYVLKEMKRERSKRERITGAVLRLTAKFIHLLAILNLWPGDNCQLLTSHSLRYGREDGSSTCSRFEQ